MKYINLRELYPDVYKTDTFVEVTEEVLAVIRATDRAEAAYTRRMYRHKAQYSLDCNNGIEKVVMVQPPTPEEILEDKQLREQLYAAVMALPDKQAKRIYAHFYLGMTPKEIAQAEGVDVSRVRDSIRKGLKKLVLKEPKTKTSIRKVFLPKTVAEMLLKRQAEQNELKELFGDEYTDYGLVFCSPMGTPIEGQVINRALNKLIEDNGLPKVVFHSLRHSSITYKLKLNGGDMKSVQGDSGHAQLKMVADVYSHIIDEDRRLNAKRFEDAFYSGHKTEDELDGLHARSIEQAAAPQPAEPETDQQLLLKLLNNPEMAALLKTLAKSL